MRNSTGKLLRAAFAIAFLSIFACALPAFAGVTVSSPSNGATVSSPVHVVASATAANPITAMRIYLDSTNMGTYYATKIDKYITAPSGTHVLTVQAWDSTGAVYKAPRTIYVAASTATGTTTTTTTAYDRYVSPTGSDYNTGTYGHPWKTLTKANSMARPGYTIHVAPGTYTFYPTLNLTTSGTSSAWITYVSDVKWGAKIVSSGSTGSPDWHVGVKVTGQYIRFKGFDITSVNSKTLMAGLSLSSSYGIAESNRVHDIPAPGPVGVGGCGICIPSWKGTNNQVIGNLVYNIGWADPSGHRTHGIYLTNHNGYVANNIVHHTLGGWGIKLGHAIYNVKAVNNTVFSNNYGGFDIDGSTSDNGGVRPDYIYVANNIVYNNGIGYNAQGYGIQEYSGTSGLGPNCSYVNNLVYGNKPGNWLLKATGGTGIGTITAAPGFVNWQSSGSGDYHLASGSPAINRGTPTNGAKKDNEGRSRPVSGNWDIGAYEYGSSAAAWPYSTN